MRVCDRCGNKTGVQEFGIQFLRVGDISHICNKTSADLCQACADFFQRMGMARAWLSFLASTGVDWLREADPREIQAETLRAAISETLTRLRNKENDLGGDVKLFTTAVVQRICDEVAREYDLCNGDRMILHHKAYEAGFCAAEVQKPAFHEALRKAMTRRI